MKEPTSGGAGTREANEQNVELATGSEDEIVIAAQSGWMGTAAMDLPTVSVEAAWGWMVCVESALCRVPGAGVGWVGKAWMGWVCV